MIITDFLTGISGSIPSPLTTVVVLKSKLFNIVITIPNVFGAHSGNDEYEVSENRTHDTALPTALLSHVTE